MSFTFLAAVLNCVRTYQPKAFSARAKGYEQLIEHSL
jgi:hypothetical protein